MRRWSVSLFLVLVALWVVSPPPAARAVDPLEDLPDLPPPPQIDPPTLDPPGDPTVPNTPSDTPVDQLAFALLTVYTPNELEDGVYVGSEFCLACHPGLANWRDTRHARILRRPMAQFSLVDGKGVVADFDRNGVDDFRQGLDLNQISSPFNPYKPNAPILSFAGGVYYITIGDLRMPVVATSGGTGEWKQRYLVRVPVSGTPDGLSAENYTSPVQYNEKTRQYVPYHPEQWWNQTTQLPLFDANTSVATVADLGRSYSQRCIGCHTTGIRDLGRDANGEWRYSAYPAILFRTDDPGYFDYDHDGVFDLVNVGCETCHGPGSRHILGGGDPSMIVNPADLSAAEANEVCGQCHVRSKSVPGGIHDWPYRDDTGTSFIPGHGEPLTDFFTDASIRWPDGVNSRRNNQQWLDFLESPKPGFQFHPVRCIDCHDPHGDTSNPRLIRDRVVEDGVAIRTRTEDNTLCLSCHAGFGPFEDLNKQTVADLDQEANRDQVTKVVAVHNNHPYGAERRMGLGRCVECHMPKVARSAIDYDIRSHTFEAIPPEKTLAFQEQGGMPSSCAVSCHSLKANVFGLGIDSSLGNWNQVFDRRTANQLERYYGPNGIWWDTAEND